MFFECLDVFAICWVKTYWDELDDDLVGAVLDACSRAKVFQESVDYLITF